jgi:hypothetical protein
MWKIFSFVVCVSLLALASARPCVAQSAQQVKTDELKRTPFVVEGLTLTLRKLDGNVFSSSSIRDVAVGFVAVRLENHTEQFVAFVPSQLVIVGKDGKQASIGYERRGGDRVTANEVRVAPGAHVEVQYNLTERIRFPAKLYYGDKLLAKVTD